MSGKVHGTLGHILPQEDGPELIQQAIKPDIFILSAVRLYREGIAVSLSRYRDLVVVGTASPAEATLATLDGQEIAIVLLDMATPNSLAIARRLNHSMRGVKIIAFSVGASEHELLPYAEAGVAGYVTADGSINDLVASIGAALNGEMLCSPRVAALLFRRIAALSEQTAEPRDPEGLTAREREVAWLLVDGLSNKEIALTMRIGSATVKNHVHSILEKLQVSRRGEAAARWRNAMTERRERPAKPSGFRLPIR